MNQVVIPSDDGPKQIDAKELINGPRSPTAATTSLVNPTPNKGSSLPDFQAVGDDQADKLAWLKARNVNLSARVKIVKLSHMRYQHPDLGEIGRFLRDFGLHIAKETDTEQWWRGYGPDPYVYYARKGPKQFLGGVFEVESREDLEKVTKIPNIKLLDNGVHEVANAPGKGYMITVEDPEGFPVSFICDQSPPETSHPMPEKLVFNDETHKPRQRKFQRFKPGPAEIYKLGHFGMVTEQFDTLLDWYTRYFNIIPSDILYIPLPQSTNSATNGDAGGDDKEIQKTPTTSHQQRKEVAMFGHIDRAADLVDHHTLFLSSASPGKSRHVHHSSFEIHDFDTQALGHQWLAQRGYTSVWGVGRHILGSQIFDYWWDTTGNMVEHYTDGDLVNMDTPMAFGPAGHEGLAVWGPEVPKAFLD